MSQHRRHYFEANEQMAFDPFGDQPPRAWPVMALAGVIVAFAVYGVTRAVEDIARAQAPVQVFEPVTPATAAAQDARIEGFRAGMRTALESGCHAQPALGLPIGQ